LARLFLTLDKHAHPGSCIIGAPDAPDAGDDERHGMPWQSLRCCHSALKSCAVLVIAALPEKKTWVQMPFSISC
jgi:hypothetical protein